MSDYVIYNRVASFAVECCKDKVAAEEFAKGLEVLIEDIARDEGLDLQTSRKFVTRELERWVKFNYGLYDTMLVC